NAGSVLPRPVGARSSTCSPVAIAGHALACAGVGSANAARNHSATRGEKAASGSTLSGYVGSRPAAVRNGSHMPDHLTTARALYEAFAAGDRDAVDAMLADDYTFSSGPDPLLDRAGFFERCWPRQTTTRTRGSNASSLTAHGRQVSRSSGVGLLAGGAQRTAASIHASMSSRPSSRSTETAWLAKPARCRPAKRKSPERSPVKM